MSTKNRVKELTEEQIHEREISRKKREEDISRKMRESKEALSRSRENSERARQVSKNAKKKKKFKFIISHNVWSLRSSYCLRCCNVFVKPSTSLT